MQTAVEEGKQTDEPAEADEPIPSRDAACWRYRERDQEQDERPVPSGESDDADRIRAEILIDKMKAFGQQREQRTKTEDPNQNLQNGDVATGHVKNNSSQVLVLPQYLGGIVLKHRVSAHNWGIFFQALSD